MGWLDDLTDWFRDTFIALFKALIDLLGDMVVSVVKTVFDLIIVILDALPVPDFISQYGICGLLAQAGPTVAWVVQTFKIAEGMTIFVAALAFRLLRKILTAFQW